jgi:hypothetical protein
MFSAAVSWLTVNDFVEPWLIEVADWPMAGCVEWVELSDDDPRKWAALLDAARHHALRVDLAQEARAEASRAVSGAADWKRIASQTLRRRGDAYIPREVA